MMTERINVRAIQSSHGSCQQ